MTTHFFWDIDGTLLDTHRGLINAYKYSLAKMSYPCPSESVLKTLIGPLLEETYENVLHTKKEDIARLVELFTEYYTKTGAFESELFPGIMDCLESVGEHGAKNVVASMKIQKSAEQCMEIFGIAPYIEGVYAVNLDKGIGDKTAELKWAMDELGADPKSCMMIGDRDTDVVAGKSCGMTTVAVLYGFGGENEIKNSGADMIVPDTAGLLKLIADATEK